MDVCVLDLQKLVLCEPVPATIVGVVVQHHKVTLVLLDKDAVDHVPLILEVLQVVLLLGSKANGDVLQLGGKGLLHVGPEPVGVARNVPNGHLAGMYLPSDGLRLKLDLRLLLLDRVLCKPRQEPLCVQVRQARNAPVCDLQLLPELLVQRDELWLLSKLVQLQLEEVCRCRACRPPRWRWAEPPCILAEAHKQRRPAAHRHG
mmetsp:Transcript_7750/g.23445  ORF Transcript_7750/g.23445 Transcript_7750/m.23445 type:complete len:203 (+) Transcript_7750:563-1171(+)